MDEDDEMRNEENETRDRENDWVCITSKDGYSFMVKRKVANISGTLRNMLDADSSFAEALANTCPTLERAPVVERLCEYMVFRSAYENAGPRDYIPIQDQLEKIPPELALELLLAADYLEGETIEKEIVFFAW